MYATFGPSRLTPVAYSHPRSTPPHQVLVSDPKELEKIRERENDITKERIQKILASGANVVLTTKVSGVEEAAGALPMSGRVADWSWTLLQAGASYGFPPPVRLT